MKVAKSLIVAALTVLAAVSTVANTEWLVRPRESASGMMLLHGVHQVSAAYPLSLRLETPGNGKSGNYRFLRLGSTGTFCFAGLNERGVAVYYTLGDPNSDPNPKKAPGNLGHGGIVPAICRSCATAEEAVKMLHGAFNDHRIEQAVLGGRALGMILLIADPYRAFIVECSPRHFEYWELEYAFCAYAQCWKLPGMDDASLNDAKRMHLNYQREWSAARLLYRAFDKNRLISVSDSIAISRTEAGDMNVPEFDALRGRKIKLTTAPHNRQCLAGCLFELESEFPETLGCVYLALGPPRYTVYLPIPFGAADALPKELADPAWVNSALERLKRDDGSAPVAPEILEFERKQLDEFNRARAQARLLLRRDKREEATALLKETLAKQAAATKAFLDGIK